MLTNRACGRQPAPAAQSGFIARRRGLALSADSLHGVGSADTRSACIERASAAVQAFPDILITTCHQYDTNCKHGWTCTKCGNEYFRNRYSIDTSKHVCHLCSGRLVYVARVVDAAAAD